MTMRQDIDGMTDAAKLKLMVELEQSLHAGAWDLTKTQAAELDRRLESFGTEAGQATSWPDYSARSARRPC